MPMSMPTSLELLVYASGPDTQDGDVAAITLAGGRRARTLLGSGIRLRRVYYEIEKRAGMSATRRGSRWRSRWREDRCHGTGRCGRPGLLRRVRLPLLWRRRLLCRIGRRQRSRNRQNDIERRASAAAPRTERAQVGLGDIEDTDDMRRQG